MDQSNELLDVTNKFFEAVSEKNYSLLETLISKHEGVIMIGSDPDDWYVGREAFMIGLKAELDASPSGYTFEMSDAKAYVEGSAGWFVGKVSMGGRIPFRWTMVFQNKESHWEITQMHASIAVPNSSIQQVLTSN